MSVRRGPASSPLFVVSEPLGRKQPVTDLCDRYVLTHDSGDRHSGTLGGIDHHEVGIGIRLEDENWWGIHFHIKLDDLFVLYSPFSNVREDAQDFVRFTVTSIDTRITTRNFEGVIRRSQVTHHHFA